jgi:DNA-binding response OmpR family regulator
MSHQVLVVDDEARIRSILEAYLTADGFGVIEAGTGAEALDLARLHAPDLVLLDIGLPDVDGLEVLRQLRTFSDMYVVLVTARAEEVDRIVGLTVGADDYVTKPFSPREVVARVRAVLRRQRPGTADADADADVLRFPGLVIDVGRREVAVAGNPVTLTALDFDLLVALASAPGRVFSRAQLLERVWGYDFFGDERVVDVHVRGMRKALRDDAGHPTVIGTVRAVGYKFLLEPVPGGLP